MADQFIPIMLVAVVLGADSFSLAMGMGLKGVSRSYELKFSSMVGIFHVIMPLIGLALGMAAGHFLGVWASRLGAAVLAYLGIDMIWKGYSEVKPKSGQLNREKGMIRKKENLAEGWINLTLLTTSVSIDALTVGFSLGTLFMMPLYYPVLIIGAVAGIMTMAGFQGGKMFSRMIGTYAQIAGGVILISLAVKMAF